MGGKKADEKHQSAEQLQQLISSRLSAGKLGLKKRRPPLGDRGAKAVATFLASGPGASTTCLNLSDNGIGVPGAQALAAALPGAAVTQLSLSGNPFGKLGGVALAHALAVAELSLVEVDLKGAQLGDVGGGAIGGALASNRRLRRLNLSSNAIGDSGAAQIAVGLRENCTLCVLNVRCNGIGQPGAEALAHVLCGENTNGGCTNRTLTELNLGANKGVSETTLQAVAAAVVRNRAPTAAAMLAETKLQAAANAGAVTLRRQGLGDPGTRALAEVLCDVNVTSLDVRNNEISVAGGELLAKAIQCCPSLTHISLAGNPLMLEGDSGKIGGIEDEPTEAAANGSNAVISSSGSNGDTARRIQGYTAVNALRRMACVGDGGGEWFRSISGRNLGDLGAEIVPASPWQPFSAIRLYCALLIAEQLIMNNFLVV